MWPSPSCPITSLGQQAIFLGANYAQRIPFLVDHSHLIRAGPSWAVHFESIIVFAALLLNHFAIDVEQWPKIGWFG